MSDSTINCGCCGEQKLKLERTKSKLTGMEILFCATCVNEGYEPREFVIIAYHNNKLRSRAIKYIRDGKYLGPRIQLAEVL